MNKSLNAPKMESTETHWQRSVPLNGAVDNLPLTDTVICCTSIPDEKRVCPPQTTRFILSLRIEATAKLHEYQTEIAAYAKQMGAIHRYDLTLDVTHLIVGTYDTPKYRYVAKERPDVTPMTIEWIEAMRELWMNDQEINMEALEKEHKLPTFTSLRFSMTGCDDRGSYHLYRVGRTLMIDG